MSDKDDIAFDCMTLNLSGKEASRLYQDIVHMDEEWEIEEPYASIRQKMERQI